MGVGNRPTVLREICRRYGVAELSVGLLYVLEPDARLGWAIEDLAHDLETLFGRKVDLVSKGNVHPLVRDEVLGEATVLYAA